MTDDPTGERLARLETKLDLLLYELLGNGQPGRIHAIEGKVGDLEKDSARMKGIYMGISAVISLLVAGVTSWFGGNK